MGAYIIKYESVEKNEDGSIKAIHCTADLAVGNGNPTDRKIKGTIHWVSATNCVDLDLKLYDKLFTIPNLNDMPEGATYNDFLNPDSLKTLSGAKAELAVADAKDGDKFQFVRMGYFCKDSKYPGTSNRVVTLKDSYKPAK
jgi:glutaminyl-tRNA synthetase